MLPSAGDNHNNNHCPPEDHHHKASHHHNGFFAHRLQKESLESLRLLDAPQQEVTVPVSHNFQEKRLSPPREEMIQSPVNVLGDQSLLLKYLNPHLVVIVKKKKKQQQRQR